MMRFILTLVFISFIVNLNAQDYDRIIGVRGGIISGITYKWFEDDENAYEAMFSIKNRGIRISGFKEVHNPYLWEFSNKLFFFYGYGVHAGIYGKYKNEFSFIKTNYINTKRRYTVLGLDAILGVEYRVLRYPFVIGLEYIPFFDLFGPNYFNLHLGNTALSIKMKF